MDQAQEDETNSPHIPGKGGMANSLIDSYAQLYNEKGGVTDNDKSEMM
jgi:hypothetical protein